MTIPSLGMVFWPIILVLLGIGAATDIVERKIPDGVSIAVAAIGVIQCVIVRPSSVGLSFAVAAVVLFGLVFAARHRVLGGGDIKLIAAVTLLVSPARVGPLLLAIAIAGGALACAYLFTRVGLRGLPAPALCPFSKPTGKVAATVNAERRRIAEGGPLPYGVAIFAGVGYYAAHEIAACFFVTSCLS